MNIHVTPLKEVLGDMAFKLALYLYGKPPLTTIFEEHLVRVVVQYYDWNKTQYRFAAGWHANKELNDAVKAAVYDWEDKEKRNIV